MNFGFPFTPNRKFSIPIGIEKINSLSEIKEFCRYKALVVFGIRAGSE
jgi:hypothetical protein